jgi:hypothetical protein
MAMCPYHGLTYVSHEEVALSSVLVDPVEALVVLPELPPRPPPLLPFLPLLPLPLPPLQRLLFLFMLLLLLGGQDGAGTYSLGAGGAVLV